MDFEEEKKYLDHKAFSEISRFFADKFLEQWKQNKVLILIEDFTTSLYYLPCNQYGFPLYREFKSIVLDSLYVKAICDDCVPPNTNISVDELVVVVDRPMLVCNHSHWDGHYSDQYVYMWSGKIMSRKKVPIEKLDVKFLMKLAQEAIKSREGLIIDEAISNRLYL